MKITEPERDALHSKLHAKQGVLWRDMYSEIHYDGDECHFWFQINSPENIDLIIQVFQECSDSFLQKYHETEFDVCFKEVTTEEVILWEFVDNDEVRGGPRVPEREWGAEPTVSIPEEYEIFSEEWRLAIAKGPIADT